MPEITGSLSSQAGAAARDKLAAKLNQQQYIGERIQPSTLELDYLARRDLRDAVLLLGEGQKGRTLDYGCGGSPYKGLLPQFAPYVRADIGGEGLDLILDEAGRLPGEPSESYDVVLSTQVLEHVPEADRYLAEAYRLLRPGGTFIVTTHGFVAEHGCPYDFYRWTADGLDRAVTRAGFVVKENYKLTLDLRAAVCLLNYTVVCLMISPGWFERFLRIPRGLYRSYFIRLMNGLGDRLTDERMVRHDTPRPNPVIHQDSLYIGLAIRARKPTSPETSSPSHP